MCTWLAIEHEFKTTPPTLNVLTWDTGHEQERLNKTYLIKYKLIPVPHTFMLSLWHDTMNLQMKATYKMHKCLINCPDNHP